MQGSHGIANVLLPVVRGTLVVATAAASGGCSDSSRILQRSRSVTSNYHRSVSPGRPASHLLASGSSVEHETGSSHRRTVIVPPPPLITYSGASVCCTPTDDQDPSTANNTSPTWTRTSPDSPSPSDAMLSPGGGGYTLQASSPSRSITVTPVGSFLAINQRPAELGESMLNIEGSSDCTSAGKNFTCIAYQLSDRTTRSTTDYKTKKTTICPLRLSCFVLLSGPDLAGGRPGVQLKLGLTKTMIDNARQLSRSLVGIYH